MRPLHTLPILLFLFVSVLITSCSNPQSGNSNDSASDSLASTVYYGGDILTMEGDSPVYVEALVVKGGKIVFTGTKAEAMQLAGDKPGIVDLAGKTLLPAFIDAHSHYISSLSVANQVNVYAPPAGPGSSPQAIVDALKKFAEERKVAKGELIQAYGYDENVMPGGNLLNRDHLDAAFPDNPVLVGHVSMHGAVLNSAALKKWNLNASTATPPGGVIVRKPGTNEPYGLIMETAYLPIFASLPKPTAQQEIEWSKAGQLLYASSGITTAHEGATHADELAIIKRVSDAGANIIDIIAYPFITDLDKALELFPRDQWLRYTNRFKIGGVKVTIDGSPQGKTAYFTTPYLTGGPGGEKNWRGELTFPQDTINKYVKRVYELNSPLNLHANGDGAIDAFIKAHEYAASDDLGRDRHVTIIHAQFTRKDQLQKYIDYKLLPSFYTLHTFYFAEAHEKNRGMNQAEYISPMADAMKMGIRATNHTDFYVAPLDQLFMLHTAVNRTSRSGKVYGADQRVSPYQGLQAMTINAAYQYQEQDLKGSLSEGKLADLVILDKNPLKVNAAEIKDIKVMETIKEGKSIYRQ